MLNTLAYGRRSISKLFWQARPVSRARHTQRVKGLFLDTPTPPQPDSDHYLKHVTSVGETEVITLADDLYASSGVLLLRKGSRVNQRTFDILSQHKLDKPLDQQLAIADCISNLHIAQAVEYQLRTFPAFVTMSKAITNRPRLLNCLRQVDLNNAMRNKISIAHRAMPPIFEHAIRVAICSVMLGMYMGLSDDDCDILAVAGLFHDLGEMHIDPELLNTKRSLTDDELKFVYAHPAIIYNILIDMDAYKTDVAQAVLEHHERIGGHGYPRGIKQLSNIYAAVLAVAEVLTSMCESYSLEKTIVTLKYNHGHFDQTVLNSFLRAMLSVGFKPTSSEEQIAREQQQLISIISSQQISLKMLVDNNPQLAEQDPPFATLLQQLGGLPARLYRSGIDIDRKDPLQDFQDDPESSFEAIAILEETLYLMRDFHRDFARQQSPAAASHDDIINWHKQAVEEIHRYQPNPASPADTAAAPTTEAEAAEPAAE